MIRLWNKTELKLRKVLKEHIGEVLEEWISLVVSIHLLKGSQTMLKISSTICTLILNIMIQSGTILPYNSSNFMMKKCMSKKLNQKPLNSQVNNRNIGFICSYKNYLYDYR